MAEVHSRDALKRARPDAAAFGRVLPRDDARSVWFYTRDVPASEAPSERQARMFMRGAGGLAEDPATGSATVAAAALFADLDPMRDGELKLTVGQGFDMGRPSLLLTRVRKQDGKIVSAHVGGSLRADDGGDVQAGGGGVKSRYTCRPARFLTATPSRSSMISAIIWRWQ